MERFFRWVCMRSNSVSCDACVTRPKTQRMVCLWLYFKLGRWYYVCHYWTWLLTVAYLACCSNYSSILAKAAVCRNYLLPCTNQERKNQFSNYSMFASLPKPNRAALSFTVVQQKNPILNATSVFASSSFVKIWRIRVHNLCKQNAIKEQWYTNINIITRKTRWVKKMLHFLHIHVCGIQSF